MLAGNATTRLLGVLLNSLDFLVWVDFWALEVIRRGLQVIVTDAFI
jgi:hypothetical protein